MAADAETIQPGTGRVRLTFAPDGGEVRVPAGTTVFDGASWNAIAIDSKGNLYTGEVDTGKRVQKFILTNGDGKARPRPHE